MKKILIVGMTPIIGGVDTFILNLFLSLHNKYHFEFLNVSKKPLAYSKLIEHYGGIIRQLPVKNSHIRYISRYFDANRFFKHHHNYDLIHLNTPTINKIYWLNAASKYGINNLIIHAHTDASDKSEVYKKIAKPLVIYNQHCLSNHTNIIKLAASVNCGRWMYGSYSRFTVIGNGIYTSDYIHNPSERIYLRRRLKINKWNKVIIVTARMSRQKNYPKILNVFYYIHKLDNNCRLIIIGTGREKKQIIDRINILHLNNYVCLLGRKNKNEVPKWLNIADMMLMPSFHEAIPFSLTEAQAAGLPALVSSDIPKEANITGFVKFLPLNVSDKIWAQHALNIMDNPYNVKLKLLMNKKVKKSDYNIVNSLRKIKRIYFKLLGD